MTYEYKQAYCNAWTLPEKLTEASAEGWDLVCLIGTPHKIQLTSTSALPNQQEFLLRRAVTSSEVQK